LNQNNCDIARDLMPLSVDGVCSEGSQRFLDGHVAERKPCSDYFNGMKAGILQDIKAEPTQEEQTLKKSFRHVGKRLKALWITLIALVCAFALLLVAAGVNQILLNYTTSAPLDTYVASIYSNDALASIGLAANFSNQVYNGFRRDEYYFELLSDRKEYVILTYTVEWFPYQHKEADDSFNSAFVSGNVAFKPLGVNSPLVQNSEVRSVITGWSSNARFTTMLETHQLCVDNGRLYMIDGWNSVQTTTGRTLMIPKIGLPVYEVRLADGDDIRTIYASWRNDEIPNASADRLDKYGLPLSGVISPSDLDKYSDFIVK